MSCSSSVCLMFFLRQARKARNKPRCFAGESTWYRYFKSQGLLGFVFNDHELMQATIFDYDIDDNVPERVSKISVLGIVLGSQFSFHFHYVFIIFEVNRQLGFISKIAKNYKDPPSPKALYFFLVHPMFQNTSIVCAPNDVTWNLWIERVLKRFVRLVGIYCGAILRAFKYILMDIVWSWNTC